MKFIIDTGKGVIVPHKFGRFTILKRKTKKKFFDYNYYMQTGLKRRYTNKHSNGYYAKVHWVKHRPYSFLNYPTTVKFTPSQGTKSYLAQSIKERNTIIKYYED